jgi:small subunit ribosomal protein S2
MANMPEIQKLLDAGVHFGHLTRKWNPNMAPYIFMERNGIHIIDLQKTQIKMRIAADALAKIAGSGRKILFVATKKQGKEIVAEVAKSLNMPFITERWPGGMLTNFVTIRKAIKKMTNIDKMKEDGTFDSLSKRERLQIDRQRSKLDLNLGSIVKMTRMPEAVFIIDTNKEHIALAESNKLGILSFALNDTNTNPSQVNFPIPGNDDATKSIECILSIVTKAVAEGLEERNADQDKKAVEKKEKAKKIAESLEDKTSSKDKNISENIDEVSKTAK